VRVGISSFVVALGFTMGMGAVAAVPSAHAESQEKGPAASAISPDARRSLEAEQAKLAWQLIEQLSAGGTANVVISPASLVSVFAVIGDGANRSMKAAMIRALGFEPGQPARDLMALVEARTALARDKSVSFVSTDRIVLAPNTVPYPDLIARLDLLHIPHSTADLSKPEAVTEIDAAVARDTAGAIPKILDEPLAKSSFVALTALHFKESWKAPLDPQAIAPQVFTSADGKKSEAAMFRFRAREFAFRTEGNFIAVDLPTSNERFSLVVITTTNTPASAKAFAQASDWLSGTGFEPRFGDVALPRLALSMRSDLLPALGALGLEDGYRSPTALTGFGPGTNLTHVIQRASIEVDEAKVESDPQASGEAHGVTAMRASPRNEDLHMVVDKPFVFAMRDRETGLILVAGYVDHPRGIAGVR
jgi:serine protease inhibitor